MSFKPVVLIYDLDNNLVDEIAATIGATGLYTSINTYNEANAIDVLQQYNRGLGLLTNKISCVITGWNTHKSPRDQLLFKIREIEKRSPLRQATPVIIITEDHMLDLKKLALNPAEGGVAAYLHTEKYLDELPGLLHKVVYLSEAEALNKLAFEEVMRGTD